MLLILEEFLTKDCYKDILQNGLNDLNFHDMLVAAPIIDSADFDEKNINTRWIQEDKDITRKIQDLCKKSALEEANPNISIFKILSSVKFNVQKNLSLGLDALFNKDKKQFSCQVKDKTLKYQFSSLPVGIHSVIEKYTMEKFISSLHEICTKEENDFITIGCKEEDKYLLYFYINDRGLVNNDFLKSDYLLNSCIEKFHFDDLKEFSKEGELYYLASRKAINRKLTVPCIEETFKDFEKL